MNIVIFIRRFFYLWKTPNDFQMTRQVNYKKETNNKINYS